MEVGGQRHAPAALPPGTIRYLFYRRLGGPQGRSGRAENLAPSGIDPRTVQPVASRYTDWATPAGLSRLSYPGWAIPTELPRLNYPDWATPTELPPTELYQLSYNDWATPT